MSQLPDAALRKLLKWGNSGNSIKNKITRDVGQVLMMEVKRELAKSSHPPGTPTPSAPGEPPSMVSGALSRKVVVKRLVPGRIQVGSTVVYARIQELGGVAGHGAQLPARPYLKPVLKRNKDRIFLIAVGSIMKVLTNG